VMWGLLTLADGIIKPPISISCGIVKLIPQALLLPRQEGCSRSAILREQKRN